MIQKVNVILNVDLRVLFLCLVFATAVSGAAEVQGVVPRFHGGGLTHAVADPRERTMALFFVPGTSLETVACKVDLPDGWTIHPSFAAPRDVTDTVTCRIRGPAGAVETWRVDAFVKERLTYLDLDGVGTHVVTGLDVLTRLGEYPSFTLSLWFCPRDFERRQHLLSQDSRFRVDYREDRGGRLEFRIARADGVALILRVAAAAIRRGHWNHLLVSSQAPGEARLYLNGALADRADSTVGYATGDASVPLVIGAHSSRIRYFDGSLRDLRIYLGRILDEQEIDRLYRGSAPTEDGLLAHWPFDEGEGEEARDLSGNRHHGTIQNGGLGLEINVRDAGGMPSIHGLEALLADMSDWSRFAAAAAALRDLEWTPGIDVHGARYAIATENWAACTALGDIAVGPLTEALRLGSEGVRAEAVRQLGGLRGDIVEQALAAARHDPATTVRAAVAETLARLGTTAAVESLLELLEDPDWNVRATAVDALAGVGHAVDDMLVRSVLQAATPALRAAAATLGRRRTGAAVPALLSALSDADQEVRGQAAQALGSILGGAARTDDGSVRDVVDALSERLHDTPEVRIRVAAALGRIGGESARAALVSGGYPADWPMWRYDAGRTAFTPHELPRDLRPVWTRQLPEPRRAWPWQEDDADKLAFDVSYEPIAYGGLLVVPSMVRDRVTAYDAATGAEVWRVYTDGPVRFAPAAAAGRIFFVSDDGFLYCVDARSGGLLWSFRGGPRSRRILGNERLIDTWPARGGPLIKDGIVYFAAGIWPSMGVFLHALEVESGAVVWTHSGAGAHFAAQVHQVAGSHSGPAPQGYLAAAGDILLMPSGRARPAAFQRSTGEFLHFNLVPRPWNRYPGMGGYAVMTRGDYFHVHGEINRLADGEPLLQLRTPFLEKLSAEELLGNRLAIRTIKALPPGNISVLNDREMLGALHGRLSGFACRLIDERVQVTDRQGNAHEVTRQRLREIWTTATEPSMTHVFLQAGSRLYGCGADGAILVADHPGDVLDGTVRTTRIGIVDGQPWSMLAADGRLFVVTENGSIHGFAASADPVREHHPQATELPTAPPAAAHRTDNMVANGGATQGYAVVVGAERADLTAELLQRTRLHLVVLVQDSTRATRMRRLFDDAGWYGNRVAVHAGDPLSVPLPPYFANLIVVESVDDAAEREAFVSRVFDSLRPYGGRALLPIPAFDEARVASLVKRLGLANATVSADGDFVTITRAGALPGSGQWTHQNADAANTMVSADSLVRAPLGVLWFGGPTNAHVLPRHGRGPIPQVAGGRLFILGPHTLTARDVYTGRVLWQHRVPAVGEPYDTTSHQAGADHVGSPYVSLSDAVYVRHRDRILVLDPVDGSLPRTFVPEGEELRGIGHLSVWEDLLLVGAEAQYFDERRPGGRATWNATSSRRLIVMNRHSGARLWQREAEQGFRHNAITAAGGMLFLADRLSDGAVDLRSRRGMPRGESPRLLALEVRSGRVLWETRDDIFGSWLGYSSEHDILLQASRPAVDSRQALPDEAGQRLTAYRGRTGERLWEQDVRYRNPCLIHGDKIIVHTHIYSLLTGEPYPRLHPVTGETIPWTYAASSNCGQIIAGKHVLSFRRGTASYYDLSGAGGTGDIGGIKAGCTPNLVPADGVLNSPDYSRTCVCQYPLQTSLALVHVPDLEFWSVDTVRPTGAPVQRLGVNFGARGYRRDADSGTLWMAYPPVRLIGGTSPDVALREPGTAPGIPGTESGPRVTKTGHGTAAPIDVRIEPDHPGWTRFYHHASLFSGTGPAWVAASGIEGAAAIELTLADDGEARRYVVRLFFAEPGNARDGQRRFDVQVQERVLCENLDVTASAGGARRGIVREVSGVTVRDRLRIVLRAASATAFPPVLCGIEVIAEP